MQEPSIVTELQIEGRGLYRIKAYRRLTPQEVMQTVSQLKKKDRVKKGQIVTIISLIGMHG